MRRPPLATTAPLDVVSADTGCCSFSAARPSSSWRTCAAALRMGMASTWMVLLADRKSTRLNSSHSQISYAVFCLKKKKISAGQGVSEYPPTSSATRTAIEFLNGPKNTKAQVREVSRSSDGGDASMQTRQHRRPQN